jgi:hypothetical protein
MKKLFTLAAMAIVSLAMFASLEVKPSADDLAKYATETYTMCIYNEGACNDIVLIGTYVSWNKDADLLKFKAVEGFEGWYVVSWNDSTPAKPEDGAVQAKPVQLDGSNNFAWDYQIGPDAELLTGSTATADFLSANSGTEVDIKNITPGILLINVKSWKNNPCTAIYHNYSVTLISPDCNEEDYVVPAISGGFNSWDQQAMVMNELKTAERQQKDLPGAVFEVSFKAAEGSEIKFRSSKEWGADWSNQLKEYVAEDDAWKAFNDGKNIVLGEQTTLEYDLGDPELYSWDNCEMPEEVDSTKYYTILWLNVPVAGAPAEVEIVGTFDSWSGTAMEHLDNGWWFAELEVIGADQFKFRQAGTWDNEIVYVKKISGEGKAVGLDNIRFDKDWEDGSYKGVPAKLIELDLSDPEVYVWTDAWVAPEAGVEDVVLTVEAKKVVVDGVLYIVRDNKLYNLQGAQVR